MALELKDYSRRDLLEMGSIDTLSMEGEPLHIDCAKFFAQFDEVIKNVESKRMDTTYFRPTIRFYISPIGVMVRTACVFVDGTLGINIPFFYSKTGLQHNKALWTMVIAHELLHINLKHIATGLDMLADEPEVIEKGEGLMNAKGIPCTITNYAADEEVNNIIANEMEILTSSMIRDIAGGICDDMFTGWGMKKILRYLVDHPEMLVNAPALTDPRTAVLNKLREMIKDRIEVQNQEEEENNDLPEVLTMDEKEKLIKEALDAAAKNALNDKLRESAIDITGELVSQSSYDEKSAAEAVSYGGDIIKALYSPSPADISKARISLPKLIELAKASTNNDDEFNKNLEDMLKKLKADNPEIDPEILEHIANTQEIQGMMASVNESRNIVINSITGSEAKRIDALADEAITNLGELISGVIDENHILTAIGNINKVQDKEAEIWEEHINIINNGIKTLMDGNKLDRNEMNTLQRVISTLTDNKNIVTHGMCAGEIQKRSEALSQRIHDVNDGKLNEDLDTDTKTLDELFQDLLNCGPNRKGNSPSRKKQKKNDKKNNKNDQKDEKDKDKDDKDKDKDDDEKKDDDDDKKNDQEKEDSKHREVESITDIAEILANGEKITPELLNKIAEVMKDAKKVTSVDKMVGELVEVDRHGTKVKREIEKKTSDITKAWRAKFEKWLIENGKMSSFKVSDQRMGHRNYIGRRMIRPYEKIEDNANLPELNVICDCSGSIDSVQDENLLRLCQIIITKTDISKINVYFMGDRVSMAPYVITRRTTISGADISKVVQAAKSSCGEGNAISFGNAYRVLYNKLIKKNNKAIFVHFGDMCYSPGDSITKDMCDRLFVLSTESLTTTCAKDMIDTHHLKPSKSIVCCGPMYSLTDSDE